MAGVPHFSSNVFRAMQRNTVPGSRVLVTLREVRVNAESSKYLHENLYFLHRRKMNYLETIKLKNYKQQLFEQKSQAIGMMLQKYSNTKDFCFSMFTYMLTRKIKY